MNFLHTNHRNTKRLYLKKLKHLYLSFNNISHIKNINTLTNLLTYTYPSTKFKK